MRQSGYLDADKYKTSLPKEGAAVNKHWLKVTDIHSNIHTSTKIYYGIGGGVYAIKESAYAIFILLFYTQVLGLSGAVTGAIVAISLIWDGISDPLIGSWSDRLRSRYGRRHPFMVYSTLPIAIGFVGLFAPPDSVVDSSTLLACWLLFWSLWVRTFITAFTIPHLALSAELTSDYHGRSQLMAMRLGSMFLVGLLLPAVALTMIFDSAGGIDGRFVPGNYPVYGVLCAGLAVGLSFISVMGTRHHTSCPDMSGEHYNLPRFRDFIDDIRQTFRNRMFRTMLGFEVASAIGWGCYSTLNILVATYVFEFSSDEVALILAVPGLLGVVLVGMTLKPLNKRWQKPQLLRLAVWGMLFNSLWLLPLKLADMLPANGSPLLLPLVLLSSTVFMFCFFLRAINAMSLVADITDQHEIEAGERKEGGFFAVMTFIVKIASLVGPLYGGIVLDLVGMTNKDLPGEVAESALTGLIWASLSIAILTLVIALIYAYKFKFSKEQMEEIQTTLRAQRAAN
ncbi:Putative glycoside/cation symporter YagG [Halioglobus japonicus]|nr:Putative glycoside/cation symporter YagG [Halioglobus japonicus]